MSSGAEHVRRKGARARQRAGRVRPDRFVDDDDSSLMYADERAHVRTVELELIRDQRGGHDLSFYEIRFKDPFRGWMEVDPGLAASFGKREITRRVRAMFPGADTITWIE